jgi:hypothetical protein
MQSESSFAPSLGEEIGIQDAHPSKSFETRNSKVITITSTKNSKARAPKLDLVSASVFIGMAAQFLVFLFSLVTEYSPRLMENILWSVFAGICVGVIAYALMKGND